MSSAPEQTAHRSPRSTGRQLRVQRIEELSDSVLSLTLVSDNEPLPRWEPGSHIDLVLPNGITRQYSLCGSTSDEHSWQIAVLRTVDSRGGSDWIHTKMREGEVLEVLGPRNNFPLKKASRYIFIAGGIGITPVLPMIRELEERGDPHWSLAYGGRSRGAMAFTSELQALGDRVTLWPEDETGLIDLVTVLGTPAIDTAIYCCGPESLITAVERIARSWPPGALHVERFRGADVSTDGDAPFEVVAVRSGVTVEVAAGQSIVGALAERGVYIQTSCSEGVCGTCETRLLAGTPEHRDAYLTDEERASGELVMPCCARAKSDRLELDV